MITLKPLSSEALPAAQAKAERYRLLNEPDQAESICEDILAADPGNHQATITLLLALTDRFDRGDGHLVARAQQLASQLHTPYERAYFAGLVAERRARALLEGGGPGRARTAVHWLHEAMGHYEEAERLRIAGNDEATLRWNACARVLNARPDLRLLEPDTTTPVTNE
ncbi:MAG: hypothetical protein AB7O28_00965 [Vicinamibacterales bacterium]